MASSNQQICNCNIIVNEMLTFVQNKLAIMDRDVLAKVCSSTFSKEDINKAKALLPNIPIKVVKSRKEVKYKDMYDIIEKLNSLDPKNAPIFVARDLRKLPVATNASQLLLKENYSLIKENQRIRSSVATVNELLMEIANIAKGEPVYVAKFDYASNGINEVSIRRGDLITNVSKSGEWVIGLVLRTGRCGMMPGDYVTIY